MKVSLNWLREFIDLEGLSPEDIGEKLTLHACELEEVIEISKQFEKIVTGKILSITEHTESQKLMKALVDTGTFGERHILFGKGLVLSVGQIVPVALPGATLPDGKVIESKKIAGEKSEGMICVQSELGYKNDSLMVFPTDTKLGISLSEAHPEYRDVLFDIDNKSLTHRPDMWGHHGFARELSAIYCRPKTIPQPQTFSPKTEERYPVEIDTNACRRFCAVKISGIDVHASDLQTQLRLENLGVRAISNLVDITNHVLLEYGQPMHVFDAQKVQGKIVVRHAMPGEKLRALDEEIYELEPSDIVIADEEKVLSIAGIMGGLESGVTEKTTDIIFESANFDAATIRKTSARLGLRSDSSMRFEKSLDPENCLPALWTALNLTLKTCPQATIETQIQSVYPGKRAPMTIALHPDKVRSISGLTLSDKEIQSLLESLDFKILSQKYCLEVQVPSFRSTKDIALEEDLIEEVVRLYGFDRVPSLSPSLTVAPPKKNLLRDLEWGIRDYFSHQGLLEVMNYSFVNAEDKDFTGVDNLIEIQNPLSGEQSHMRVTLLSNFLKNLESELRTHKKLSYFEIGKVFEASSDSLPFQKNHLGLLFAEISNKENDLFFQLKTVLESFFQTAHISYSFVPASHPQTYAHPAKTADILIEDRVVGSLFAVHPSVNNIKNSSIVFAEMHLDAMLPFFSCASVEYTQLSPYPTMLRDISLLTNKKDLMKDLEQKMFESAQYLKKVDLFDEFEDEKRFGSDKKNLAFHLTFGSTEKTLTDVEVEADFQLIVHALKNRFGSELRM